MGRAILNRAKICIIVPFAPFVPVWIMRGICAYSVSLYSGAYSCAAWQVFTAAIGGGNNYHY